ncbi:MAG TPA: response regulator transcription factor [Phycisphaerae bacterium]|nr:response regulator transcription factor [Phycisphaerae bacterium]
MASDPTVFIVDDDQAVRDSLQWLIQSVGLNVVTFPDALSFLNHVNEDQAGCVVLDVRLPGISGLELQQKLAARGIRMPVIIVTGHGDVPMAVRAMKAGALDFIEKPFSDQVLLDQVQKAIDIDSRGRAERAVTKVIVERLHSLSPREREVLERVVEGKVTREIAAELSLADKTVEAHRARVMEKMKAGSIAELVRLTLTAQAAEQADEAAASGAPHHPA